jgi:hypothetical protein
MAKWLTDDKVLKYYEGRDNPFPLDIGLTQEFSETLISSCPLRPLR